MKTSRWGLGLLVLGLAMAAAPYASAQPAGRSDFAAGREGDTSSGESVAAEAEKDEVGAPDEDTSASLPPRVPWRGTSLKWEHAVTTSALGVGRDNIGGEGEVYQMSWQLLLNYYLVDQERYKLSVYTAPSFSVELTNSDWTTTQREPIFDDLPLAFALGASLYKSEDSAFVTSGSANFTFIFPTSPTSYDVGTYLTTSPRLALSQSLPIAGEDSPVLPGMEIGISGRWDHRFGAATTAVNPALERPRQTSAGSTFLSDQLSFSPIATNTLREGISLALPHQWSTVELVLFGQFSFAQSFKPEFAGTDCEVQLATGCVQASHDVDPRTSQNTIGFTAGLSFFPTPELGMVLAYANGSTQLGPDGERRSIFYSPDAVFVADLLISLDAIYERLIGPPRSGSFVLARDNKRKERRNDTSLLF